MPAPANLIHETSTTTGTGNLTVAAVNGKVRFSDSTYGFGTGGTDVFWYFISNQSAAEWEIGTGHMSDANTLVRDTILFSSNSNNAVNFSAGTKDVTNDIPAANQIRNENSTVTDGHGVLFDGTSGRAIKSLGGVPNVITSATPQATTSGSAIDFTGVPAGTRRITIQFDEVDLSGTDDFLVQIGDSGGIETTSYRSMSGNRASEAVNTTGFLIRTNAQADTWSGHMILTRVGSTNRWISSHVVGATSDVSVPHFGGGAKTLSAELDRWRLDTTGTNTFSAGQISALYE